DLVSPTVRSRGRVRWFARRRAPVRFPRRPAAPAAAALSGRRDGLAERSLQRHNRLRRRAPARNAGAASRSPLRESGVILLALDRLRRRALARGTDPRAPARTPVDTGSYLCAGRPRP